MIEKLIGMIGINWVDVGFLAVVLIGALYWWARKAAKHPDYASAKEAKVDAGIADLMRRAGVGEDVIAKVVGFDATAAGAEAYARGQAIVDSKLAQATKLVAEARAMADTLRANKL
jgi:hypothetical protein